jgi:hypothetical protein
MTYAAATDVQTRLGRTLTPEEADLVTVRLADVERLILRRIPDLADKITANDVDVENVIQVEADAVLRLVRNPEGYASETDGNYGYTFSREVSSGRLEILTHEWVMLGEKASGLSFIDVRPRTPFEYTPGTVHPFMTGG